MEPDKNQSENKPGVRPENKPVAVSLVRIRNVMGLESLEFRLAPRGVTCVYGPNESGKTSVLAAVKSAVEGGYDATLLRKGADAGDVVLVLDNGVEVREMLSAGKRDLRVRHPEVGTVGAAQSFLDRLVNRASLNPVDFVDAEPKRQLDMFLAAVPVAVTPALADLVGAAEKALPGRAILGGSAGGAGRGGASALAVADSARQELYDERRVVNRELDRARKAAEAAREAVPAGGGEDGEALRKAASEAEQKLADLAARAAEAENQIDVYRREGEEKARARIDVEEEEAVALIEQDRLSRREAFHRAILKADQRVRAAELELAAANAERMALGHDQKKADDEARAGILSAHARFSAARQEAIGSIQVQASAALLAAAADSNAEQAAAKLDLDRARDRVLQWERQAGLRKLLADRDLDAKLLASRSEVLTDLIDRVDREKAGLMREFPIPGVTVESGEIKVGGIPFQRCSESRRWELAMALAELAAGDLKLVVVDGLERLDQARFEAFRERAARSNVQFLCTRVDDGAFRVEDGSVAGGAKP